MYAKVSKSVDDLPPPPSAEPDTEMNNLINNFRSEVEAYTEGSRHNEQLIQDLNRAYLAFKKKIWATAPRFSPFTREDILKDTSRAMINTDFVGEMEDMKEKDMDIGGLNSRVMNLDTVREHIQK